MGKRLRGAGRYLGELTATALHHIGMFLAGSARRLQGPADLPDPHDDGRYDWDSDPDGRVW
jgi:hypothetical protein